MCGGGRVGAPLVRGKPPSVIRMVVVPADRKRVDSSVLGNAGWIIHMPGGTSYRDRNTELVRRSDRIVGFWTGQQRSGTYMTMNIAWREGKILPTDIFGVGLSDTEVRKRFSASKNIPQGLLSAEPLL